MGCGCGGKGNSNPRNLKPTKILSLAELRAKIVGTRPDSALSSVATQSIPAAIQIFKTVEDKINPLVYFSPRKTIILITRCGSAEGKYLKNLLSKFATITPEYKASIDFLEVECGYLINPQDFTSFPSIVFMNKKSVFKRLYGLFDVRAVLNDFHKLP